jgi:ribosome-associated translation inhibitor RaiA
VPGVRRDRLGERGSLRLDGGLGLEEQLLQPLDRLLPEPSSELDVMLRDVNGAKGGLDQECAVTVHLPNAAPIHVQEVSDDMFKSVHLVADRLERAVSRQLEKMREHGGERAEGPGLG